MILRKLSKYLRTKYDIGLQYDPSHSFADLLTRHLYARQPQKEPIDLSKQIVRQCRNASIMFYLRRVIRKLKLGVIPIRIVFLAQDPLDWLSLDSLYRECASDSFFKTYILNVGFTFGEDYSTNCSTLFGQRNIEYLDGIHTRFRLDLLNPDIVILSSPYDDFRPEYYRTANLLRYAKLVYICYGPDFADGEGKLAQQIFGYDTQKNAWRIFSRSERTVGMYGKYGGIPPRRIVSLGHPRIDQYYSSSADALPEAINSASAGKFKIIYAPHHTLEGWSTFLRYANHIRRLVHENEDCYLVFRPHPLLVSSLKNSNLMSEEAFRSLFVGDRCCLYEGDDYYALFRWSDVLISDASSFLVEYAPTQKPIMYLHREDGWGIDDTLWEDVSKSCYVARSENEITALVQQLKTGWDPLRGERERYQENMNVGMFVGGAGKRIAAYLRDRLA